MAANVVLRPVSQAINRRSAVGTELTTAYRIELSGPGDREEALRALLLDTLPRHRLRPQGVASEDAPDGGDAVNVETLVFGDGRDDAKLETVAAELQRDPDVRGVSWKVTKADHEVPLSSRAAE